MKLPARLDPAPPGGTQDSRTESGGRHTQLRLAFIHHILESKAESSVELRRAAARDEGLPEHLAQLVEKIHRHSYKVVDADIAAARATCSEDEIFEVILSACIGASEQRVAAGLNAVEEAMAK